MVSRFSGDLIILPIDLRELYDFINPSIEVRDYLFNFPKMEKKEQIYSNDRKDPGTDQTENSLCQVTLKKRKSFGLKTLPQLCPLSRYSATSLQVLRPYFRA